MSRPANVAEFLLEGKDPAALALLFHGGQCAYGELGAGAYRAARAALSTGAQKGDRVALVGESSPFWVASYLGILRAGLVCVPLPAAIAAADLDRILLATGARIAFAPATLSARAPLASAPVRILDESAVAAVSPEGAPFPDIAPDDLAALMFTSGSTGAPRGVMISHGNIVANTESIIETLALTCADRILAVLPFHYCFGASLLHTHLRVGGSLVIEPRFVYPEVVLQRMADTCCTGFAGVPSHFQLLLRNSSLRNRVFPALRYVQQAGGRLAPSLIRELCEALPSVSVFIMYGQTEATARLSSLSPEDLPARPGSVGRGVPGVSLRVLDGAGRDVRPGEVGEIVARGASIARGYWNAAAESAVSFRDGALYTGDLATVDEDGFIYILDRARDFLKCGGVRVSSRRLEDELLALEEVVEAAVIGVPDDVLGESAIAFIVPRASRTTGIEERLTAHCRTRLPVHCVPRRVIILDSLPKNAAGKVLKAALKASWGAR